MNALAGLWSARTWKRTLHLVLDLPLGILWFTVVVTLVSLAGSLLVLVVGVPILACTVLFGRLIGTVERGRARALLDVDLPSFPNPEHPAGLWPMTKRILSDGPGWRGALYGLVMLPWGIVAFTAAIVIWALPLGLIAAPFGAWLGDDTPGEWIDRNGWPSWIEPGAIALERGARISARVAGAGGHQRGC